MVGISSLSILRRPAIVGIQFVRFEGAYCPQACGVLSSFESCFHLFKDALEQAYHAGVNTRGAIFTSMTYSLTGWHTDEAGAHELNAFIMGALRDYVHSSHPKNGVRE